MATAEHPNRRLLVAVDMQRYSRQDNESQWRSQRAFRQVMDEAVRLLDLDRADWITQQGGDGELAILPAGTPETVVAARLAPTVGGLLRDHNRDLAPAARVRLRLAIHQGLVHLDGANGFPGEAVVTVCRLVDAAPLKRALDVFPDTDVALIVSGQIYQDVIRQYGDPNPRRCRRVAVHLPAKDFHQDAWIYVPDEDAALADGLDEPDERHERGGDQRPGPTGGGSQFNVGVVNGPTVMGDHTVNTVYGSGDVRSHRDTRL